MKRAEIEPLRMRNISKKEGGGSLPIRLVVGPSPVFELSCVSPVTHTPQPCRGEALRA